MSSTAPLSSSSETKEEPGEDMAQIQPSAEAGGVLPERPRRLSSDSRMLSIGRIFNTNDSMAQLLNSTDSVTRIEGLFRSGASVELPPLSMGSEAEAADAKVAATEEKKLEGSTEGPATSEAAPATYPESDPFVQNLTKSEDSVMQKVMQSLSRATKSAPSGKQDSVAKDGKPYAASSKEAAPDRRSGIFTSREWGSDLGPFQDVNIQDVFQTSQNSITDKPVIPAQADAKTSVDRRPKKKRDWNALVMKDLQASIAKPEDCPSKEVKGATPADAALLAAAAAAFGKNEGPASSKPLKKRPAEAHPPVATPVTKRPVAGDTTEKVFVEPTDEDVLMGRGGRSNNHPGNKRYLEAKDSLQARYMAADKNGKTPISQELVDIVKGWGGRFLKQDNASQMWYEVDATTARKKCSQTLREINTPEERRAKRARYSK